MEQCLLPTSALCHLTPRLEEGGLLRGGYPLVRFGGSPRGRHPHLHSWGRLSSCLRSRFFLSPLAGPSWASSPSCSPERGLPGPPSLFTSSTSAPSPGGPRGVRYACGLSSLKEPCW